MTDEHCEKLILFNHNAVTLYNRTVIHCNLYSVSNALTWHMYTSTRVNTLILSSYSPHTLSTTTSHCQLSYTQTLQILYGDVVVVQAKYTVIVLTLRFRGERGKWL